MRWGVSVTPRPLFTPGKDLVPIVQEAGWAPGPVWTGAENLASSGIRSPNRPARSQSLYRLRYPAHHGNFHDHGTRRGWGVSVTSQQLFTPGEVPVPIVKEAGWVPGPVWTGAGSFAPTRIRSPDRPARSQSLYRLRYPAHHGKVMLSK